MNVKMILVITLFFSTIKFALGKDVEPQRCHFSKCIVSIMHLVATPLRYHKKVVVITGVFAITEQKDGAVYLDLGSRQHLIDANGIYVRFESGFKDEYKLLDSKYGIIEATFNAQNMGPSNNFIGTLTNIRRMHPWPPNF